VEPPTELRRYVAEKGSIAIDGISLTVAQVLADEVFTVAIIPHTFNHTHLSHAAIGDPVNLEVDVVARYVERLLTSDPNAPRKRLELEDLRRLGYSED
jgi:riboflavin synthase